MWNFFAQVLVAVLLWIEERAKRGHVAVESDRDDGRIRRAGSRLREWVRSNRSGELRKPDASRPSDQGPDVHADSR